MKKNLIFYIAQNKSYGYYTNNPNMLIIFEHFGICYEFNNKLLEEVVVQNIIWKTDIVVNSK
jgi:hypothetical protein